MSDLIIKKNGTDYKLPMLAEHYPADRVYLDGDVNKSVQDWFKVTSDTIVSTSVPPLGYVDYGAVTMPSEYTLIGVKYEPLGAYGTFINMYVTNGHLTFTNTNASSTADAIGRVTYFWKHN